MIALFLVWVGLALGAEAGGAVVPGEVRQEARDLQGEPRETDWRAVARLAGWQTLMGAWVCGPNLALSTRRWVHPAVNMGGMALGASLGATSALWYARRVHLDSARATAIVTSQQLGVAHGISASILLDRWRFSLPVGLAAGAVVGTAGGYLLAGADPPDGVMAAARSGVYWGGYLATMTWLVAQDLGWRPEDDREIVGLYTAIVDVGILSYGLLAHGLALDRSEIRAANLGGALGFCAGGLALLTFLVYARSWPGPPVVAATLGTASILGAVVGARVERGREVRRGHYAGSLLVQGAGDRVRVGLPVPVVIPVEGGVRGGVQLVDVAF